MKDLGGSLVGSISTNYVNCDSEGNICSLDEFIEYEDEDSFYDDMKEILFESIEWSWKHK